MRDLNEVMMKSLEKRSVISCHDDVFFTPIYINGKEYKINDMII